jgi:hypothetical protein
MLRGPSFGYPEQSNWRRGFWQCSNFTGFTHPTKQNKQTNNKQTNERTCGHRRLSSGHLNPSQQSSRRWWLSGHLGLAVSRRVAMLASD